MVQFLEEEEAVPQKIAIIGGGVAGLGAAWALSKHPDRFDIRLFEANDRLGGNAITVDMPQDDGRSVCFDISVTACIPTVYTITLHSCESMTSPLSPLVSAMQSGTGTMFMPMISTPGFASSFNRRLKNSRNSCASLSPSMF